MSPLRTLSLRPPEIRIVSMRGAPAIAASKAGNGLRLRDSFGRTSILLPVHASMAAMRASASLVMIEIATPFLPARPVRPIRCT